MFKKKLGVYALTLALVLAAPMNVFAAQDSSDQNDDDPMSGLTTRSSSHYNDDDKDKKATQNSNNDLFGNSVTYKSSDNVALTDGTTIKTTQSQYLLTRENDINSIKDTFTDYFVANGDKENPIYFYSNTDDENPAYYGKIMTTYIDKNLEVVNGTKEVEVPYEYETKDENGNTITETKMVTNTISYPEWYSITLDNEKTGYIKIEDTKKLSDIDNIEYDIYDILSDIDKNGVPTEKDAKEEDTKKDETKEEDVKEEPKTNEISLLNDYETSTVEVVDDIDVETLLKDNEDYILSELGSEQFDRVYAIRTSYLTSKKPMYETQEEVDQLRVDIVNYAKQFIGNPYVRGGTDPVNGADCSGFVMTIYKHFGIDIYRLEQAQANCGKRVTKAELKPGDLVFYTNEYGYIGHVAIYIGNGQILHASNPKPYPSGGIKVSNLEYGTQILAMTNVLQY